MINSLSGFLKKQETPDSINFSMEELEELEQDLISKIQDVSEEHDQPLFKELVFQYLQEKMKTLPA